MPTIVEKQTNRVIGAGGSANVIIISHRRSGTHLLIDSIRNNFEEYKDGLLTLDELVFHSPWVKVVPLEMFRQELIASRRLIKTHTPANFDTFFGNQPGVTEFVENLLESSKKIVIYRDGRDVLTSLYHFRRSFDSNVAQKSFSEFIRMENDFGVNFGSMKINLVEFWKFHVESWLDQKGILAVSFEQLRNDYPGTMSIIGKYLEVRNTSDFKVMIRNPKFQHGRKVMPKNKYAEFVFKSYQKYFRGAEYTTVSFRRGTPGDYAEHFLPQDLKYFDSVAGNLMRRLGYS